MFNRNSKCRLAAISLSILSFGSSLVMADELQPVCGPGENWIYDEVDPNNENDDIFCQGGTDNLPTTRATLTIEIPCGSNPSTYSLRDQTTNPTIVERQNASNATPTPSPETPPSAPPVNDDHINTEIVSMVLQDDNNTMTLRAGVNQRLSKPSLGKIIELLNDSTQGYSFFEVYFEIDGTPLGTLYNKEPHIMERIITQVPPDTIYTNPQNQQTNLYIKGDPEEKVVACLSAEHSTSVELVSFTATPTQEGVTLNWKTAFERDNAGFHIFKAKVTDVSQVTQELIPAKGNLPNGTEYTYVDKQLTPGIWVYVLVDVDTNGKTSFHLNNLQVSLPK